MTQNSSHLRSDANQCFVCGPNNPVGLGLSFRLDDDVCRSEYTPSPHYCGYDGVTHGGIVFSALDDVMANWLFLKGIRAYTAKCEIRYKKELPTGTRVLLEGHCLKQKGRLTMMRGIMIQADSGEVVAEAEASFMQSMNPVEK